MELLLSMALAGLLLIVVGMFFFVVLFEVIQRLRWRFTPPRVQLKRADLGHYPHWYK